MDADLKKLWRLPSRTLGPALKGAFQMLWLQAGCEPNHLVITKRWLASACGAEPRTAIGWIRQLDEKGLVSIIDRDEQRGTIQLLVYRPTVLEGQLARAMEDPQTRLPFGGSDDCQGVRPDPPPGVSARKPPPPECQETGPMSGENDRTDHEEVARVGVSARKPPSTPGVSARKPPPPECQETGPMSGENDRTDHEEVARVGVSARKPPPPGRHLDLDLEIDIDRKKFLDAVDACRSLTEQWRSKRIIPDRPIDPRNAELMLQAKLLSHHVAFTDLWDNAAEAVLQSRPDKPFGYFRTCLRRAARERGHDFDACAEKVPLNVSEVAPNGEHVQRE